MRSVDSAGHMLYLGDECQVDCETCSSGPCPNVPCTRNHEITDADTITEWDGSYYVSSTCGATSCEQKTFVKPGRYVAKFCATPGTLTGASPTTQCVATGPEQCSTVEFSFPSNGVTTGILGDVADSG